MARFEVGSSVFYGKSDSKGTIVKLFPATDKAEVEWEDGGTWEKKHSLSKLKLVEESTGRTRRQTNRYVPPAKKNDEEEEKKPPVPKRAAKVGVKRRVTKPANQNVARRRTASITVASLCEPSARPQNKKKKDASSSGKETKRTAVKEEDEFHSSSPAPREYKKGDHVFARAKDGQEEYDAIVVEESSSTSEFIKIKWESRKGTEKVRKSSCRLMFDLTAQDGSTAGLSRRRPTRKAASVVAKMTYPSSDDEPKLPVKRVHKVEPPRHRLMLARAPSHMETGYTSSDESEECFQGRSTKRAKVKRLFSDDDRKPAAKPLYKEESSSYNDSDVEEESESDAWTRTSSVSSGSELVRSSFKVEDDFSEIERDFNPGEHLWVVDVDGCTGTEHDATCISQMDDEVHVLYDDGQKKKVPRSACRLMFDLTKDSNDGGCRRSARSRRKPVPLLARGTEVASQRSKSMPKTTKQAQRIGTGGKAKETAVHGDTEEASEAYVDDDLSTVSLGSIVSIVESAQESSVSESESDSESIFTEATSQFPSPGQAHPKFPGCHAIKDTPEGWVIFTGRKQWNPAQTKCSNKESEDATGCAASEAVVDVGPCTPCAIVTQSENDALSPTELISSKVNEQTPSLNCEIGEDAPHDNDDVLLVSDAGEDRKASAANLVEDTNEVLLDCSMETATPAEIHDILSSDDDSKLEYTAPRTTADPSELAEILKC